ncbi:MAG: hypothetical protein WCW17_01725 [Patescibacteria group bacterium]|jgi:hypothetical protein
MKDGLNQPNLSEQKNKKKICFWVILIIIISAIGLYCYLDWQSSRPVDDFISPLGPIVDTNTTPKIIPQQILDNKFGWLGGGIEDSGDGIVEKEGGWMRPHPGAFVWDMMQKSKDGEIDFSLADTEVKNIQKNNLGILATIWPFADWDQKNLSDAENCKVSENDEFLPKNDKKGRGVYLPECRCNPSDWASYQKFVEAVVERYDGDGISDMPGLIIPIKYWEVMNEPDLQYGSNAPIGDSDRLTFYKQGPTEYGELLKKSYFSIKSADSTASVLIAGAAGADERMLGFYEEVFADPETKTSFDIGNIHCISNDQQTHDFNVTAYKKMLASFGITKPIWVTEAEAMYGTTGETNFQSTKTSTTGAIAAGAERIFFTRDDFGDTRTDMSKINTASDYPSAEKYREIIKSYLNK